MGSALCRRPLLDVECSLKAFDFLCVFVFSLRSATQLEGGTMLFCHLGVGVQKGVTIAFWGAVWDPCPCILGTLGGQFGTFGVISVTRGCPGGSKRHPLESEEVFNKCLTDLGSLFGITLGSFL